MMARQRIKDNVRDALMNGERLTSLEAYYRFECHHLASVIRRLRGEGMAINSVRIEVQNRNGEACHVAQYSLAGTQTEGRAE